MRADKKAPAGLLNVKTVLQIEDRFAGDERSDDVLVKQLTGEVKRAERALIYVTTQADAVALAQLALPDAIRAARDPVARAQLVGELQRNDQKAQALAGLHAQVLAWMRAAAAQAAIVLEREQGRAILENAR